MHSHASGSDLDVGEIFKVRTGIPTLVDWILWRNAHARGVGSSTPFLQVSQIWVCKNEDFVTCQGVRGWWVEGQRNRSVPESVREAVIRHMRDVFSPGNAFAQRAFSGTRCKLRDNVRSKKGLKNGREG